MENDWQPIPLCEVLTERQEKPLPLDLESGAIRIVSKIGFNDGKIQLRNGGDTRTGMILIRPGDLVVSGINAIKGAVAVYDERATAPIAATIHYAAYLPNRERVDIRFLWWLLRSETFREILLQSLPGGIKSELKPKRFLSVPVPLPSLSGQQRIVARIEALARRVEEARGLRRAAVEEAEAIKRRAIDFFISPRLCRQPLTKFLAEPLLNGLSIHAAKMGIGNLFAKVGIVNTGVLDPHQTKYVDVQLPPDSPNWMRRGDLFVSRGNTPNLVGRAAVYEGNPPDCAMPDLLIRIRVNLELADPKFIARYFHSSEARQYVESHVTGTSPTMKKISQPKLEAMPIPVLPLTEQHRIVAYLDGLQAKVDELRRLQAETQKELNALMPSILAKEFAGEL